MGVLTRSGCPKPEVLLAYEDNTLADDEDRIVADHLRVCDRCHERIVASREIGVLLRRHVPLIEDPEGLAELKRRLREPEVTQARTRRRVNVSRLVAVSFALVAVIGVGLASTEPIQSGDTFGRWLDDDEPIERVRPEGEANGAPLTVSGSVAGSSSLPFGLVPVSGEQGSAHDRYFRSATGLVLSLVVEREDGNRIFASSNSEMTSRVAVNGREVYVSSSDTPAGRAVVAFDWVENDQLKTVLVLEQPEQSVLTISDAKDIAAALMTNVGSR